MKSSLHCRCFKAVEMWYFVKVVLCDANWNPEETIMSRLCVIMMFMFYVFIVNCWDVFALLGNS